MGDLDSEGRKTVTGTRGRKLVSIHQAVECFKGGDVPKVWAQYYSHVFHNNASGCIVQNVCAAADNAQLVSMYKVVLPGFCERRARSRDA